MSLQDIMDARLAAHDRACTQAHAQIDELRGACKYWVAAALLMLAVSSFLTAELWQAKRTMDRQRVEVDAIHADIEAGRIIRLGGAE